MTVARITYSHADVELPEHGGTARVFYRETRPERDDAPVLLLLHGFPTTSHQYRRLMETLGTQFRLVAPDLPGFGLTETPAGFGFTFDGLADVIEGFVKTIGLSRFAVYVFDYGAPTGYRIAERHPEWITGFVVQNGNAYLEGFSEAMAEFVARDPGNPEHVKASRDMLRLDATRWQYEHGVADKSKLNPDAWSLDQYYLDRPGREQQLLDLEFNYHTNAARYDGWHAYFRKHTPPMLIVWGANDPFFPAPGARAYLADLPDAELHLYDTGHFALETHLDEIAPLIEAFLNRI